MIYKMFKLVLVAVLTLWGCKSEDGVTGGKDDDVRKITGIAFDDDAVVLRVGQGRQLTVYVKYADSDEPEIYDMIDNPDDFIIRSSDEKVVRVDEIGYVSALSEGDAVVSVVTFDGLREARIRISVRRKVSKVEFYGDYIMSVGQSMPLKLRVQYEKSTLWSQYDMDTDSEGFSFESSAADVVSVDELGMVSALGTGTSEITAVSADGMLTASITVRVLNSIDDIRFAASEMNMAVGEKSIAALEISYQNGVWQSYDAVQNPDSLRFSSFDSHVASFANGEITAVSAGRAIILARSRDGALSAMATVTVVRNISAIKIKTDTVAFGAILPISVAVVYEDEPDAEYDYDLSTGASALVFSSSEPSIITVDASGNAKGISDGISEITVATSDGAISVSKKIVCYRAIKEILFVGQRYFVDEGGQSSVSVAVRYEGNEYTDSYDLDSNPKGLRFEIDDESIATVDEHGVISGLKYGMTDLKVFTHEAAVSSTIKVNTCHNIEPSVFTAPLSMDLFYSYGARLPKNGIMQCFDIDSRGDIYYAQIDGSNKHNLNVSKAPVNGAYQTNMKLSYFGHGTNFAIEEDGTDTYIWMSSYANRTADNSYWSGQTVARVKYQPGMTFKPEECSDHYYVGMYESHAAIDEQNDLLMIMSSQGTGYAYCNVYSLEEAKNTPLSTVQLNSRTWGGGTSSEESQTASQKVQVHDLRKIKPIAEVQIKFSDFGANVDNPNQGFEVGPNRIYNYEGTGRGNGTDPSEAVITVFDFKGNMISRIPIAAIEDIKGLNTLGIASTGYMEAEGMKIIGDKVYLGFGHIHMTDKRSLVMQYPF